MGSLLSRSRRSGGTSCVGVETTTATAPPPPIPPPTTTPIAPAATTAATTVTTATTATATVTTPATTATTATATVKTPATTATTATATVTTPVTTATTTTATVTTPATTATTATATVTTPATTATTATATVTTPATTATTATATVTTPATTAITATVTTTAIQMTTKGAAFLNDISQLKPSYFNTTNPYSRTLLKNQMKNISVKNKVLAKQLAFDLGGGNTFSDPLLAASFLLRREYGQTYIFDIRQQEPVFMPAAFLSGLYSKNISTLEYNVYSDLKRTVSNMNTQEPGLWVTQELNTFTAGKSEIDNTEFIDFLLNVKISTVIRQQGPQAIGTLPTCNRTLSDFVKQTNTLLQSTDRTHILSKELNKLSASKIRVKDCNKWTKRFTPNLHWAIERLSRMNIQNISGESVEQYIYNTLNVIITEPDVVILHSLDFFTKLTGNTHHEFDFLLLSSDRKLALVIECKRSWAPKAVDQLTKYKGILEDSVGDIIDSTWTYVPVVYCNEKLPCPVPAQSALQVLSRTTDMKRWWSAICNLYPPVHHNDANAKAQIRELLEILVFCVYATRTITQSFISEKVATNIDLVTTTENIIFYSNDQLQMIKDVQTYRHVVFLAQYGAGKTFMLKEKAVQLAKSGDHVSFIYYSGSKKPTLLHLMLKQFFAVAGYTNIHVVSSATFTAREGQLKFAHLVDYIRAHPGHHIMVDEWDVWNYNDEQARNMVQCTQLMPMQTLWIVLHKYITNTPHYDDLMSDITKYFKLPQLTKTLRNTKEIIQATQTDLQDPTEILNLPPANFPSSGTPPKRFKIKESELANKTIVKKLVEEIGVDMKEVLRTSGVLLIVGGWVNTDAVKTLIECVQEVFTNVNTHAYFVRDDYKPHNYGSVLQFLDEKTGVCVIDDAAAAGCEWNAVVSYCADSGRSNYQSYSRHNVYLRAISKLVIVEKV